LAIDSSILEALFFTILFIADGGQMDKTFKIGCIIGILLHIKSLTISIAIAIGPGGAVTALT
jgi:hypothetical protein